MKRQGVLILTIVVLVLSALACTIGGGAVRGSGEVVEEEREVSGITGVTFETVGNLYIEEGEEESLRIEAEDNLIPHFQTQVDDGILTIGADPDTVLGPTAPVNFYLTVQELNTLELIGSGDIEVPSLGAEMLTISVSGSGDINVADLNADVLEVRIPGSGDLRVSDGSVNEQSITIDGSGRYQARDLQSVEADVSIGGSGSVTIRVQNNLEVSISGSGSVRYAGSPTLDRVTVSGSGSIEQIEQ